MADQIFAKTCKKLYSLLLQFFTIFCPIRGVWWYQVHITLTTRTCTKGHKNFLHVDLRWPKKKHTLGVVESRGSVMDSICDKRRGLTIEENGKESIRHTGIEHWCLFLIIKQNNPYTIVSGSPPTFCNENKSLLSLTFWKVP